MSVPIDKKEAAVWVDVLTKLQAHPSWSTLQSPAQTALAKHVLEKLDERTGETRYGDPDPIGE